MTDREREFHVLSGRAIEIQNSGGSINTVAQKLKISWRKAKRLVDGTYKRPKKAAPSSTKKKRLSIVERTAKVKIRRGNREQPAFSSANSIAKEVRARGIDVHERTIVRDLHELHFHNWVRPQTTELKPEVFAARVRLARSWKDCSDEVAKQFVFVDEAKISTNDHSYRRQWAKARKNLCRRQRKRRTEENSFMVFAAIGVDFRFITCLRNPRRPKYPRGRPRRNEVRMPKLPPLRLNANSYVALCLKPLIEKLKASRPLRKVILVQDGARPHISNVTLSWLKRQKVNVLADWAPNTPQFNPIENAWPHLNRGISDLGNPNANDDDLDELENRALSAWNAIPTPVMNSLCLSFRDRLRKAIDTQGRL